MDKYYRKKMLEDLNKRESVIIWGDVFVLVVVGGLVCYLVLQIFELFKYIAI